MKKPAAMAAIKAALNLLRDDRNALVECSSKLDKKLRPRPGTIDPVAADKVQRYDAAIAGLETLHAQMGAQP